MSMYPWPTGDFDNTMDVALDTAMNYLEPTGQAQNFVEVQRVAAMAILAAWKKGSGVGLSWPTSQFRLRNGKAKPAGIACHGIPFCRADHAARRTASSWHPCARLSLTSLRPSPSSDRACRLLPSYLRRLPNTTAQSVRAYFAVSACKGRRLHREAGTAF